MTVATTTADPNVRPADALFDWVRRHGWTLGLVVLFALLLVFTKVIQPRYGVAGIQALATSALPLALAAVAQAICVIGGGIDLSIGAMMTLMSVIGASLMEGQSEEVSVAIVIAVVLLGFAVGAVNGSLVVLTRVPDIIVTLAMSFVWGGAALLVLSAPGGAAATWLRELVIGSIGNEWIPKAVVLMLALVALVWIPLRRSGLGLSIYAIGSNQLAAFRSGVAVGRTKVASYAFTGLFAALAGLSLTASTGIGTPVQGPYTLLSVAAVVLGGVSLAGGRGGVLGPIVAVLVLQILQMDMSFLRVDTNLAIVLQGLILIGVVMFGGLIEWRRSRR